MSQTIEPLGQSIPSFDQIVKGNVSIKKLSKYRYRITFSKIGKFLIYQVWDKDDVNKMNAKREVGYVSAKEWVKTFNKYLEIIGKPLFTPTTIMETEDDCNYAFVIHNTSLNSCGKVVFTVSTKEISLQNNTSKKLVQLPEGKCNHVRFDIDAIDLSPEQARQLLIENPDFFFGAPYNYIFINIIYGGKKGKDMSDDDLNKYISDIYNYTFVKDIFCNSIMGADCKNQVNYLTFNRWKKAMDYNNLKCPDGDINDLCDSGCFKYDPFSPGYPGKCITVDNS
jgi:hypothetical protein